MEQYVQNLTHEIKSPLSALRGAAELLAEPMERERRNGFSGNIRQETNRIQIIVDRMLELAALENRSRPAKAENVDVQTLVRTVVESKQPQLVKRNVTVEDAVPDGVRVPGDLFLLHQAVSNLLQNAIDFSSAGGRIRISASAGDHIVELQVTDEGTGIPDYAAGKVFDKFYSLERPVTGRKSTGLGLNFVREVALLHSGDILIENTPGCGVCATLVLPLRPGSHNHGDGSR